MDDQDNRPGFVEIVVKIIVILVLVVVVGFGLVLGICGLMWR